MSTCDCHDCVRRQAVNDNEGPFRYAADEDLHQQFLRVARGLTREDRIAMIAAMRRARAGIRSRNSEERVAMSMASDYGLVRGVGLTSGWELTTLGAYWLDVVDAFDGVEVAS